MSVPFVRAGLVLFALALAAGPAAADDDPPPGTAIGCLTLVLSQHADGLGVFAAVNDAILVGFGADQTNLYTHLVVRPSACSVGMIPFVGDIVEDLEDGQAASAPGLPLPPGVPSGEGLPRPPITP